MATGFQFGKVKFWRRMVVIVAVLQSLRCVRLFVTPWTAAHQAPYPSLQETGVCLNSCPLSPWCHPNISSSIAFSSCLQSFPASRCFPMSQLFTSGSQSIGALAYEYSSALPINILGLFPLGLTGLISLQFKGLSRDFSNTTVQKKKFIGAWMMVIVAQ